MISQAVSEEKMFEYYGNIHAHIPEDQWASKRSPETRDIYQKTCLTRMVIYMYITPGLGQSNPWIQFLFENIKLQSICQFTKSFALQMTF